MAVEKTTESVGMKITVNHGEREGKVPSFIQVSKKTAKSSRY